MTLSSSVQIGSLYGTQCLRAQVNTVYRKVIRTASGIANGYRVRETLCKREFLEHGFLQRKKHKARVGMAEIMEDSSFQFIRLCLITKASSS